MRGMFLTRQRHKQLLAGRATVRRKEHQGPSIKQTKCTSIYNLMPFFDCGFWRGKSAVIARHGGSISGARTLEDEDVYLFCLGYTGSSPPPRFLIAEDHEDRITHDSGSVGANNVAREFV